VGYAVEIKRSAEREMNRLPDAIHRRVSQRILALDLGWTPSIRFGGRDRRGDDAGASTRVGFAPGVTAEAACPTDTDDPGHPARAVPSLVPILNTWLQIPEAGQFIP
jgi:hypothetical protein